MHSEILKLTWYDYISTIGNIYRFNAMVQATSGVEHTLIIRPNDEPRHPTDEMTIEQLNNLYEAYKTYNEQLNNLYEAYKTYDFQIATTTHAINEGEHRLN